MMSDQENEIQRVEFRLFSFGIDDAKNLLLPEGTMVLQGIGFPTDFEDCTCIPIGPVSFWSRTGVTEFDAQWYRPVQTINRADIPQNLTGSPRVNGHICHKLRSDLNIYPVSTIRVGDNEVHIVYFENKKVIFKRLGHAVTVDLEKVPNNQRFTLAIEWSYDHIEIRVSWLEGENLERYYSGEGISREKLDTYERPGVGKLIQYVNRKGFEVSILPAGITRAIWKHLENSIDDKEDGKTSQDVNVVRKVFQDKEDFLFTLLNVFEEMQKILLKGKPYAFWDGENPKSESHAGASLRNNLESICSYKNIRVSQEIPSRSGDVDFVFTGISTVHEHLTLVLELKNAHSPKLERGVTHQLPTYINEQKAAYGVYGVLWYKGQNFNLPAYETIENCISRLEQIKHKLVSRVIGFDVSFHIPASKL